MSKKLRGPATAVVAGNVPAPVRVRLKRVSCDHAIPHPPDGQAREWWQRLKNAFGTTSSAFVNASLQQLIAASGLLRTGKCERKSNWRSPAYRHAQVFGIISDPSLDNKPQLIRLGSYRRAKGIPQTFHDLCLLHAIEQTSKISHASSIRPAIRGLLAHFVQRQDCRSWLDCCWWR